MGSRIKELWQAEKAVVNVFLGIPSGFAAEVLAQAGWDSMTVDLQHGAQDYLSMVSCFQGMLGHPVVPLVRVPSNDAGMIGKVLDGGACGVICPLVNNREEAERFVAACRYPPDGFRSNGAIRHLIYTPDYIARSKDEVLTFAMIESREAVENMEEIVSTPGLDAIYIGPNDLGLSMGYGAKMERDEDEILEFYERLLKATSDRGIHAGIHCSSVPYAERMMKMGFRLISYMGDTWHLSNSARAGVKEMLAAAGR